MLSGRCGREGGRCQKVKDVYVKESHFPKQTLVVELWKMNTTMMASRKNGLYICDIVCPLCSWYIRYGYDIAFGCKLVMDRRSSSPVNDLALVLSGGIKKNGIGLHIK